MPGQFSTRKRPPIKKGYSLQLLVSISDPVNGFIKISAILRCDFICCTSKLLALSQTSHLKHCWNLWNVWILEPKNELKTARKICSLFFRSVFFFNNTDMSYFLSAMTNCGAFFICFFADFIQEKKHSHTLAMSNLITIRKCKHLKKTQFHTLARNAFVVLSQQCEIFVFAAISQLSKRRHL